MRRKRIARWTELRVEVINDAVTIQTGVGNAGAVLFRAFDLPCTSLFYQAHLVSASPPIVELAGKRNPHCGLPAELIKASQQGEIKVACRFVEQIVWMNDEADQTMLVADQFDLLFPKVHRALSQDIEERVVLRGDNGDLQDLADKVGLGGAAPTVLRVEMAHVGHGHIVGTVEKFIPVEISIKNSGPVAGGTEFPPVVIDACNAAKKFFTITK